MSFPGEYDASTGFLEKFRDCLSHAGASLVHQRLDLDATGKCSLLLRLASAPKSKLAGPINPPDLMTPRVLPSSAGFDEVFFFRRAFLVRTLRAALFGTGDLRLIHVRL